MFKFAAIMLTVLFCSLNLYSEWDCTKPFPEIEKESSAARNVRFLQFSDICTRRPNAVFNGFRRDLNVCRDSANDDDIPCNALRAKPLDPILLSTDISHLKTPRNESFRLNAENKLFNETGVRGVNELYLFPVSSIHLSLDTASHVNVEEKMKQEGVSNVSGILSKLNNENNLVLFGLGLDVNSLFEPTSYSYDNLTSTLSFKLQDGSYTPRLIANNRAAWPQIPNQFEKSKKIKAYYAAKADVEKIQRPLCVRWHKYLAYNDCAKSAYNSPTNLRCVEKNPNNKGNCINEYRRDFDRCREAKIPEYLKLCSTFNDKLSAVDLERRHIYFIEYDSDKENDREYAASASTGAGRPSGNKKVDCSSGAVNEYGDLISECVGDPLRD